MIAVLSGGNAYIFFEKRVQMTVAAESQTLDDLADRKPRLHQKALRLPDAAVDQILRGRVPGFPLKKMGEMGRADVELSGDLFQRDGFPIIMIQIGGDPSYKLSALRLVWNRVRESGF